MLKCKIIKKLTINREFNNYNTEQVFVNFKIPLGGGGAFF